MESAGQSKRRRPPSPERMHADQPAASYVPSAQASMVNPPSSYKFMLSQEMDSRQPDAEAESKRMIEEEEHARKQRRRTEEVPTAELRQTRASSSHSVTTRVQMARMYYQAPATPDLGAKGPEASEMDSAQEAGYMADLGIDSTIGEVAVSRSPVEETAGETMGEDTGETAGDAAAVVPSPPVEATGELPPSSDTVVVVSSSSSLEESSAGSPSDGGSTDESESPHMEAQNTPTLGVVEENVDVIVADVSASHEVTTLVSTTQETPIIVADTPRPSTKGVNASVPTQEAGNYTARTTDLPES